MKNNKQNKMIIMLIFIILIITSVFMGIKVHAENNINSEETYESPYIPLSGTSGKIIISDKTINGFSNINYITNANYFMVNPYHAKNDESDNYFGTCTTVAMQMLLGYHNYYSDRRIIPELGDNNLRFLNENYGILEDNPKINTTVADGYGRLTIGTEVGLYEELMDLNDFSNISTGGQAIYLVAGGARKFIRNYASALKDDITIEAGLFSDSLAKAEIDAGRPIILGCEPFSSQVNFHVVVAYGYAKYNGVDGYIVHEGYEYDDAKVWYPTSWFGFRINMSVNHNHNIVDRGENINQIYRKTECTTCGFTDINNLYKLNNEGNSIIGLYYPLFNNVTIPSTINGISITSIGNNAFERCDKLTNIILPNSITSIGNYAFKGCSSIKTIDLPAGLIDIGIGAFQNCSSLTSITIPTQIEEIKPDTFSQCFSLQTVNLPNNLKKISDRAFIQCTELTSINLPENLEVLGDRAFEDCEKLTSVNIQRKKRGLISLGTDVFTGCHFRLIIYIQRDRFFEYFNDPSWAIYKPLMAPSSIVYKTIDLNCLVNMYDLNSILKDENKVLKLNVECKQEYKMISMGTNVVMLKLYDSNYNLLIGNNDEIIRDLNQGTYYLSIESVSTNSFYNVSISFTVQDNENGKEINFGTINNILTHLHCNSQNTYLSKLYYYNTQGDGFYKFTITGQSSGEQISYNSNMVTIYDNVNRTVPANILKNLQSASAITQENDNSIWIYLEQFKTYYIDINALTGDYDSLVMNISKAEKQNVSLADVNSVVSNEYINILSSVSGTNDYAKELRICERGIFSLYISYTGNNSNNACLYILKKTYNDETRKYDLEPIISRTISNASGSMEFIGRILDKGDYYIGYYNLPNGSVSGSIQRFVDNSIDEAYNALLVDPNSGFLCGSQIRILESEQREKSYNQTFITKNFTRILYIDKTYDIDTSRLAYDWYSSNESIATVTSYGTILGKEVGTVKIIGVLKSDPSKVYIKEFTVIDDRNVGEITVNSTYEVKYSDLTDNTFKLNLEKINCPYPWLQDYSWSITSDVHNSDINAYMNVWGDITVNKQGCFTLTGIYLKNENITVVIHVVVK